MSFEFHTVDAHSVREEVIDFFWDHRKWPGVTRNDYCAIWDWRYSALSEGPAIVHIARLKETGKLVGHVGIYRRNFRFGDVRLRIGVPGNLFADPEWHKTILGVRLVMFLRSVVQRGEFDAVLGFGNHIANEMLARFNFTQLGAMHTYVDVRDVKPVLRRRSRSLSVVAPVINAAMSLRRRLRPRPPREETRLEARPIAPDEILKLDRTHWTTPERLVAWDSNRFILHRYFMEPDAPRHMHGLFDPDTGSLEAYVVSESTTRIKVWDCQTNPARLGPVSAISSVAASHWPRAETILVPTIPHTRLAAEMVSAGFLNRRSADTTEENTYVSAYWMPDNPRASIMSDSRRWNIWIGSRHY